MRGFVLPLDKPEGPTSHDLVAAARRALGERRIGHTGTLDPFASGLLLLCVGWATRLAEYLAGLDKTYECVARLGVTTDTEDRDGQVVEVRGGWEELSAADVLDALAAFEGEIDQVPPQYSAKKVCGEAMHRRARRGETVELAPRPITVHELALLELAPPEVRLRVRCSSGTYVRSLAREVGEALGVGAHLVELRRTAVGGFSVGDALSPTDLEDERAVARVSLAPLEALQHLPRVTVDEHAAARLAHGQWVRVEQHLEAGLVAVAVGGTLVAVGEVEEGRLKPRKVFAP